MVCVVGSNQPFEIEYCTLSKETHPTIVVIVFADSSLWAPKVCKNQAWVLKNLEYKLDRKYQLHHGTISCWLVAPMPRLFPMPVFFCEKIFLFGNSEMVIKCAFLHPQSWNLVQMKANKILFILFFFSMSYDTRFKSYDHLTGSPHFMQKWNILNSQLPPLEFRKHRPV